MNLKRIHHDGCACNREKLCFKEKETNSHLLFAFFCSTFIRFWLQNNRKKVLKLVAVFRASDGEESIHGLKEAEIVFQQNKKHL